MCHQVDSESWNCAWNRKAWVAQRVTHDNQEQRVFQDDEVENSVVRRAVWTPSSLPGDEASGSTSQRPWHDNEELQDEV